MRALVVCLFSVLALSAPVVSAADAASQLIAKLSGSEAIAGQFRQTQYSAQSELLQESSGTFVMQRPGLLRWETVQPFPQLLVSNGVQVWLYDPDLEQVTVSPVKQQELNAPAVILSNDPERVRQQFRVALSGSEFVLTPVKGPQTFRELRMIFSGNLLQEMNVLDSIGQRTHFVMSEVKGVGKQDLKQFEFEPPAGVDVLVHE